MVRSPMPRLARLSLAFTICAAFTLQASAAKSDLVRETLNGTTLQFQLLGPAAGFTVVITGPAEYALTRTFSGHHGSVNLLEAGEGVADGSYHYEVRVEPIIDGPTRAALKQARDEDNPRIIRELKRMGKIPSVPLVHASALTVLNGSIFHDSVSEESIDPVSDAPAKSVVRRRITPNDQVIPDDLIVQSSLCVGFDCVNNESFGFHTFRLKENNLRIHFDDTSTSAGFPANDWQLTANDSDAGGANSFSIDDLTSNRAPFKIEASARANAVYIDSNENIGFGNSVPGLDLHLTTTDTPALRLEQTNGGGFTAQTWDIGANEANFFIRDTTGGSLLSFRIRPGAPTSSIDIAANGEVGIGTANPESKLHVKGSDAVTKLRVEEANATPATRTLLELKNQGQSTMSFLDAGGTASYGITGPGTTVNTLAIANNEAPANTKVLIGGSGETAYTLDVQGTLRVTGNVISASTKAGIIPVASFVNNVATVTFATPFPDTNYSISLTTVTTDGSTHALGIKDKTAAGFTVKRVVAPTGGTLPGSGTPRPAPTEQILEVNWTALVTTN